MQTNTHARPVFTYTIGENENKLLFSLARRKIKAGNKPLLNILMSASADPRVPGVLSVLTRAKISASLQGRTDSEITRVRKSNSKQGVNNPFYGKGPGIKALDIAAEKAGTKVYVYDATNFTLVSGGPFRSIRMAAELTHISARSLARKLDTGKPFKGYYYYSHLQSQRQNP
jgi:group I intron endonuclease